MLHIVLALLMFVLGYLIRYKRLSWLIAGYNTSSKEEKDTYDVAALSAGVGNLMFLLGGTLLVAAIGQLLGLGWAILAGWVLFVAVMVAALVYMNTGNRYRK